MSKTIRKKFGRFDLEQKHDREYKRDIQGLIFIKHVHMGWRNEIKYDFLNFKAYFYAPAHFLEVA